MIRLVRVSDSQLKTASIAPFYVVVVVVLVDVIFYCPFETNISRHPSSSRQLCDTRPSLRTDEMTWVNNIAH